MRTQARFYRLTVYYNDKHCKIQVDLYTFSPFSALDKQEVITV